MFKNVILGLSCALVLIFIGFVLWVSYKAQDDLQKTSHLRYLEYVGKESLVLDHFLSERKDDLLDLACSRELNAYFENKALGMSLKYGLMASLAEVSSLFDKYKTRKKFNDLAIYKRITFIDTDGKVLVDDEKIPQGGMGATDGQLPPSLDVFSLRVVNGDNQFDLILSLPYFYNNRLVGAIIARVDSMPVRQILSGCISPDKTDMGYSFLVLNGKSYSPGHAVPKRLVDLVDDHWVPTAGKVTEMDLVLDGSDAPVPCSIASVVPSNFSFHLIHVMTTKDVNGTLSPGKLLIFMSCLSFLILAGFSISFRLSLRNLTLNTNLDAAERLARATEANNQRLEKEVSLRKKAEAALQEINTALELRIQERTKHLANEIVERKEAEKTNRLFFNSTYDAILITDENGRIIDANRTMLKMFRIERDAILKRSVEDFIVPDLSLDRFREYWMQTVEGKTNSFEWMARRPSNNDLFDVEVALSKIELNGKPVFFINFHDISVQKAIEFQRKEHQDFLSTIFRGIKAAVIVFDSTTGKVADYNSVARQLFALETDNADQILSHTKCIDPTGDPKNLFELGTNEGYAEGVLQSPDKAPVPISRQGFKVHIGGSCHVVQVIFDITERKNLERKLGIEDKLKSVGKMASGISHEINSPIQYIGDSLHFLKKAIQKVFLLVQLYDDELKLGTDQFVVALAQKAKAFKEEIEFQFYHTEAIPACDRALKGVNRVAVIVLAMKNFSHPGLETMQSVNINNALNDVIILTKSEWKYTADLQTELDPDLPVISCFPGSMNQVFLNLIVNAAHAIDVKGSSREKGIIHIRTRALPLFVEIVIKDSGCGIPPDALDKIFDPFFTTKEPGKGTGQGLAIVYDIIVEKHRGNINVKSEPGEGAEFIIQLPIKQINAQSSPDGEATVN